VTLAGSFQLCSILNLYLKKQVGETVSQKQHEQVFDYLKRFIFFFYTLNINGTSTSIYFFLFSHLWHIMMNFNVDETRLGAGEAVNSVLFGIG